MDSPKAFEIPLGRLSSVAPGLPTTDLARTVEHYGRLGFTFSAPGSSPVGDAGFAIAERDGIELHFALKPDHDPTRTAAWVYVRVEDADELAAEFEAAGAGQGRRAQDTDYEMRELAHTDPDGNLILFGSRLAGPRAPAAGRAHHPDAPKAGPGPERDHDPAAFEFATALKHGDVDRLKTLLRADPTLATSVINTRRPLHLFADAPGHRPNAAAVVAALVESGADLDAHALGARNHETALHWAASNDDVELIDALLDAGADIEHPGSSIDGGPPIQSALGYAQWAALQRLFERGAKIGLSHAAALGMMPLVTSLTQASPPPGQDDISAAFWNACRAGQLATARHLSGYGAELNWRAPWSGETPLDAAMQQHQRQVVGWLASAGAISGSSADSR
jgi:ankyrin repeat protein